MNPKRQFQAALAALVRMKGACMLLCAAVGLGLLTWIWFDLKPSSVGSVRQLQDGSSVELVAVTYGRLHKLMIGPPWQKLLLPIAPKPFATTSKHAQIEYKHLAKGLAAVPSQLITYRSDTPNALVFWTLRRKPTDQWDRCTRAVAVDELGNTSEDANRLDIMQAPDYRLTRWEFTAFPRRGKRVTLRIHQGAPFETESKLLLEFTVPNPD